MGMRTVKNYPSPRLVSTIGATNQTAPDAIGELVANCFDARVGDEPVSITIDLRAGQVKVIDDCRGMTSDVLEHAVCIGEDMSRYIERSKEAKGHFGMGFKTSCATLGERYTIRTRPINGSEELKVTFDISDYATRPTNADAWDVVIEDGPFDWDGPLGEMNHGTAFVIDKLRGLDILPGAIHNYLGNAFKGHLLTGDHIFIIDGTGECIECKPNEPKIIEGTRIEIKTECGPDGIYKITGWMGLDRETHNKGDYGFNIYRNKQLVKRWDKSWFPPHLMTSRIVGEVDLNFLDATFYKQGLQETEAWLIVKAHMTQYVKKLVSASRQISRKGNVQKPAELAKVRSSLAEEYGSAITGLRNGDLADGSTGGEGGESAAVSKQVDKKTKMEPVVTEKELALEDNRTVNIAFQEQCGCGVDGAPFDYVFDESDEDGAASELLVVMYTGHPLISSQKANAQKLARTFAISDSIYRVLVEKMGYEPRVAQRLRNKWVEARVEGK